jgi:hypothetical protein
VLGASSRLRFRRGWSHSVKGSIDCRAADAEEFGEFGLGVGAEVVQLEEVLGLVWLQLRLLASQPALGFGALHPFSGAQPDQIGLDYVDSPGPSSRITGWTEPFARVELWPLAVGVHRTGLSAAECPEVACVRARA